jgi:molecular chaperone Hsp33
MTDQSNGILRAITDDHAFRVVTLGTTAAARGVVAAQHAQGELASYLADLVTGTIMIRETMAPQCRVQGIVRNPRGALVADSHPSGDVRGLVQLGRGSQTIDIGAGATLQMMRTLANGAIHQGLVAFPTTGGISEALMAYMQTSEQVTSVVAVDTVVGDDGLLGAGGYMVQLLPEAGQGPLGTMIERLERFGSLRGRLGGSDFGPGALLAELLDGMPHSLVGSGEVRCHCWCDEVRVMSALSTLKRADLEDLLAGGEPLSLSCDYCGRDYRVRPAQLRGLLKQS